MPTHARFGSDFDGPIEQMRGLSTVSLRETQEIIPGSNQGSLSANISVH